MGVRTQSVSLLSFRWGWVIQRYSLRSSSFTQKVKSLTVVCSLQASSSGAIVPLTLGKDGKVQYDQLLRQGRLSFNRGCDCAPLHCMKTSDGCLRLVGSGKDKIIHSTYDALVPVQISHEDPRRDLPDEDEVKRQTEATKKALGLLVEDKIAAAQTSRVTKQSAEPTYVVILLWAWAHSALLEV